ncbi:MAG: hypothetical protein OHK0038_04710 [Flammeovirgaceae bacterium]
MGGKQSIFFPASSTNFDIQNQKVIYQKFNFLGLKTEKIEILFSDIDSITYDIERTPWRNEVLEYLRVLEFISIQSNIQNY